MTMVSAMRLSRQPRTRRTWSVGTLELFFDLVFGYAMPQVTILMLADTSWAGFGRGLLALAAVWWA